MPAIITSLISFSSLSTIRSAAAPARILPRSCKRSISATLLVNAGNASSSAAPLPSSVPNVSMRLAGLPMSICSISPCSLKTGRQPPPSELIVTRSAGAPYSRFLCNAASAAHESSSSATGKAVISTVLPTRASSTASSNNALRRLTWVGLNTRAGSSLSCKA